MPVKGEIFESFITTDQVLEATNGGYDIYMYYLGKVKRIMKRPWPGEKEEKDPSWGVIPFVGATSILPIWFWKDYAREESGTAIQFVQRYFGLEYKDAMDKIIWDFGLGKGKQINVSPVKVTWEAPDIERDYADIRFSTQPFKDYHHDFWNIAEVSENDLKKLDYYAVKDIAVNGRRINVKPNEPVFAFFAGDEGVKIYFPQRKERRFINNIPYHYLWNFDDLKECEDLFVQKSPKDLAVTRMITPCVTATQAEAIRIFFDKDGQPTDVVKRINSITKRPWIFYGSDDDGVKKCKEITETAKYRYINTPKKYLPDVNDAYGFVRMHNLQQQGTGLKALEDFMRSKKALK